jgi:hypothetical protein
MIPRGTTGFPMLAIAAALLLSAGSTRAQQPPLPLSVAAYNRALTDDKLPIERLWDLGHQAASDLLRSDLWPKLDSPDHPAPDKELAVLQKQMPGFGLAIGEYTDAMPKIAFFKDLSGRRGRPQDVAFFSAMADEFPYGSPIWPDYYQQTTDSQGCTRLDGTLTRIDSTWRGYRKAYPHSYAKYVARYVDEAEAVISSMAEYKHVCACGEQPAAEHELEGLAKVGPQDRLGKSAANLLRGLRDHSMEFKANCRPN